MHFIRLAKSGAGFTNQLFAMITGIIFSSMVNQPTAIIESFMNDYSEQTTTPISCIFNMPALRRYIQTKYGILIADKYAADIQIQNIVYGTEESGVDVTETIMRRFGLPSGGLFIPENIAFNDILGDPCPGIAKRLAIYYTVNGESAIEIYEEILDVDVCFQVMEATYHFTFGWIDLDNRTMFDDILTHIEYHPLFVEKARRIREQLDTTKNINVLHLRLEDDAIQHWSNINGQTLEEFRESLSEKYIALIRKYIAPSDQNIVLSASLSNPVIEFMRNHGYSVVFSKKYFKHRELNAIVDLLVAGHANHRFLGNFNPETLNGSSFSYYVAKRNPHLERIYVDLDAIDKPEFVEHRESVVCPGLEETS